MQRHQGTGRIFEGGLLERVVHAFQFSLVFEDRLDDLVGIFLGQLRVGDHQCLHRYGLGVMINTFVGVCRDHCPLKEWIRFANSSDLVIGQRQQIDGIGQRQAHDRRGGIVDAQERGLDGAILQRFDAFCEGEELRTDIAIGDAQRLQHHAGLHFGTGARCAHNDALAANVFDILNIAVLESDDMVRLLVHVEQAVHLDLVLEVLGVLVVGISLMDHVGRDGCQIGLPLGQHLDVLDGTAC
ncbi:hypothetical protein D9M70_491390 [compost metagenome]